jgi:YesN/AraC family two-component response regulator
MFASGCAVELVNVLLKTGNITEAGYHLDEATVNHFKPTFPRNAHNLYEAKSRYYLATGNNALSLIYMDSMLIAKKQRDEQFNTIILLRMEQKETAKKQQELIQEIAIRRQTQLRLLILAVGFIIIFSLLGIVFVLYRHKRAAYRALVRKTLDWAQTTNEYIQIPPGSKEKNTEHEVSHYDRQLFEQMHTLVQGEHLYRQPSISIEEIAHRMSVNKTYLSRAINNCTGNNFKAYINEYRIKETVKMMTDNNKKFSLEGYGYEAGFINRKTFYTAFKKLTGLSPSDFRNNLHQLNPESSES